MIALRTKQVHSKPKGATLKSHEKPKAFALRLPPDLRQWVEAQAVRTDRSLNWVVSRAVEQAKLQERREAQQ